MSAIKPIFKSEIVPNTSWEFYVDKSFRPQNQLVTAVSVVVIKDLKEQEVIITKNKRGWEVIAGHVESDESPEEAAPRESMEEGGTKVDKLTLFGYTKVTRHSDKPYKPNYPHPISYVLNFFAHSIGDISKPTGDEIFDSKTVKMDEVKIMVSNNSMSTENGIVITEGLKAASR